MGVVAPAIARERPKQPHTPPPSPRAQHCLVHEGRRVKYCRSTVLSMALQPANNAPKEQKKNGYKALHSEVGKSSKKEKRK